MDALGRELIDSLAVFLGTLADEVTHSVMPRDRLALTRVFPVLGGVPEVSGATYPSIESADQQELRHRAMNALRELLQRLAIREPLVLYVDDLQWGDEDSADLLADLVRPPDAAIVPHARRESGAFLPRHVTVFAGARDFP